MSNSVASNTSLLFGYTCNVGAKDCVSAWASADCSAAVRYMCQVPLSTYTCKPPPSPPPRPPPPPTPPPPNPCRPGDLFRILSAFPSSVFCFVPIATPNMPHDNATDYCDINYNGATLPVITNQAQNDQIRAEFQLQLGVAWSSVATSFWLGYQLETGTFVIMAV
jgi:hypothetical protein